MSKFSCKKDTNLISEIFKKGIINTLENSSVYKKSQIIFLAIFLVYFLYWIFSNISSKTYNQLTINNAYKNGILRGLSFLVIIFIFIDWTQSSSKNELDKCYYTECMINFTAIMLLFQIVDFISLIFIFTLIYYRYKNLRKYYSFKKLSFEIKALIACKVGSYLTNLFNSILYPNIIFNININSDRYCLLIYLLATIINDICSKFVTLFIIHKIKSLFKSEMDLSNNAEVNLNRQLSVNYTVSNPANYPIDIDNNSPPPTYEECMSSRFNIK